MPRREKKHSETLLIDSANFLIVIFEHQPKYSKALPPGPDLAKFRNFGQRLIISGKLLRDYVVAFGNILNLL